MEALDTADEFKNKVEQYTIELSEFQVNLLLLKLKIKYIET